MKEILHRQKFIGYFFAISATSLLHVSAGNCQITQMDESGTIRNEMGIDNSSEMVAVQGSPCAPAPTKIKDTYPAGKFTVLTV
jgi:hypothetical protein